MIGLDTRKNSKIMKLHSIFYSYYLLWPKSRFYCKKELIEEVVKRPKVRSPIIVYEPSLERKKSAQYLWDLAKSSDYDKRQKWEKKRNESHTSNLYEIFYSIFDIFLLQYVFFQNENKESQRRIKVDMFEVQQCTIS